MDLHSTCIDDTFGFLTFIVYCIISPHKQSTSLLVNTRHAKATPLGHMAMGVQTTHTLTPLWGTQYQAYGSICTTTQFRYTTLVLQTHMQNHYHLGTQYQSYYLHAYCKERSCTWFVLCRLWHIEIYYVAIICCNYLVTKFTNKRCKPLNGQPYDKITQAFQF